MRPRAGISIELEEMWRGVEGWNEGEEKGLRDLNNLLQ